MTPETCMSTCAGKGFSMAGVEFGQECYCGNTLANGLGQPLSDDSQCNMPCAGDNSEQCGGNWVMNLFKSQTSAPVTKRSKHFGRPHARHSF